MELLKIIWKTWDEFWRLTSINGVNRAGLSDTPPYIRRVFWIAIFIPFMYLTCDSVVDIFVEFYTYPVQTSVSTYKSKEVSTKMGRCTQIIAKFLRCRSSFQLSQCAIKTGFIAPTFKQPSKVAKKKTTCSGLFANPTTTWKSWKSLASGALQLQWRTVEEGLKVDQWKVE